MIKTKSYDILVQGLLASLLGCLLGGSILLSIYIKQLPPYWILGVMGGVILMIIAARRPDLIILSLIFLTSSIINETNVPFLEYGLKVFLYDGVFIVLIAALIIRMIVNPDYSFVRTPLDLPMILFWGFAMLATYLTFLREVRLPLLPNLFQFLQVTPVYVSEAIPEIRIVSYYLIFFIITNLFNDKKHVNTLVKGMFVLAFVSATAMLLQEYVGVSLPLVTADVRTLTTEGVEYAGITRIIGFTGEAIVLVAFITKTAIILIDTDKPATFGDVLLAAFFGLGVLITFLRTFWIASALTLFLLLYLATGKSRSRLLNWGLIIIIVLILVYIFIILLPDLQFSVVASSILDRFGSFTQAETYSAVPDSTLRARDAEYGFAIPQIFQRPIFGIGLGSAYRPAIPSVDPMDVATRDNVVGFIHNAHIWIILKGGIFCYLSFLVLGIIYVIRGLTHWRHITDLYHRSVLLGFSTLYIGLNVAAIVVPVFMVLYWVPLIAIMMGVSETIIKLNNENSPTG